MAAMVTPHEREARMLKEQAQREADAEFKREQDLIKKNSDRIAAERVALERQRAAGPAKIYHLLVAKQTGKFRVVGLYSDREKLAGELIAATVAHAAAGSVLGVVEFDLSVRLDQPARPPS